MYLSLSLPKTSSVGVRPVLGSDRACNRFEKQFRPAGLERESAVLGETVAGVGVAWAPGPSRRRSGGHPSRCPARSALPTLRPRKTAGIRQTTGNLG